VGYEVGFSEVADMKPPEGIKPLWGLFYTIFLNWINSLLRSDIKIEI